MTSPYLSDINPVGGFVRYSDHAEAAAAEAVEQAALAAAEDAVNGQLVVLGLARELADALDAPRQLVFATVWNAPAEMADLLETPHGWVALAHYVAAEIGLRSVHFMPRLH